jgi:hypothetical protein
LPSDERKVVSEMDPIEQTVADALNAAEILFIHKADDPETTKGHEFYLPTHRVFINCKPHFTARITNAMAQVDEVIAVQGYEAALTFAYLLSSKR